MTRLDMIAALRQRPAVDQRIDLFNCDESEITKIYQISEKQQKGISKSVKDWQFLNKLAERKPAYKARGKISNQ